MRDVVVCLPGITGSVLQKDGRDVWNISGGALINALATLGRSIGDLKLERRPARRRTISATGSRRRR